MRQKLFLLVALCCAMTWPTPSPGTRGMECTSVPTCIGCTDYGNCKQVELVSMEELIKRQNEFINGSPSKRNN